MENQERAQRVGLTEDDLRHLDSLVFDYLRRATRDRVGLHHGVVARYERIRDKLREGFGAKGPREAFDKAHT